MLSSRGVRPPPPLLPRVHHNPILLAEKKVRVLAFQCVGERASRWLLLCTLTACFARWTYFFLFCLLKSKNRTHDRSRQGRVADKGGFKSTPVLLLSRSVFVLVLLRGWWRVTTREKLQSKKNLPPFLSTVNEMWRLDGSSSSSFLYSWEGCWRKKQFLRRDWDGDDGWWRLMMVGEGWWLWDSTAMLLGLGETLFLFRRMFQGCLGGGGGATTRTSNKQTKRILSNNSGILGEKRCDDWREILRRHEVRLGFLRTFFF